MILLIIGLVGLWLGTKWMINGALGIAERFNLSHSFVGVAILAVGTDLPEVFVSVQASFLHLKGIESSGIITGNAIGSSISQITVILGVAALFMNFTLDKPDFWRDSVGLGVSISLLFIFGIDGIVTRFEGSVLLLVYCAYYVILLKSRKGAGDETPATKSYSNFILFFYLFAGLFVLILSAHTVVDSAMALASRWGVAQSFVGIAIVGLGTSLPELAVSVGAAIRKSTGMSVGNIIGSNIFDGLIPIGLGGVISTTNMDLLLLQFDLPFLLAVTLFALTFLKSKMGISKLAGIALIASYVLYLAIKLFYFEGVHPF